MAKILERAKRDLFYSMESSSGFGNPVRLISPFGEKQILNGQVSNVQVQTNVSAINQTNLQGEQEVIFKPAVCFRIASLNRIPVAGEIWIVQTLSIISENPLEYETLLTYATEANPVSDYNIGIITLQLTEVKHESNMRIDMFELVSVVNDIDMEE